MSSGADEIIALSRYTKIVIILTLIGSVIIVWLSVALSIVCTRVAWFRGKGKHLISTWLFALVTSQVMHIWYEAHYDLEVAGVNRHLPAYYPATAQRKLLALGLLDPDNVRRNSLQSNIKIASDLQYPLNPLVCEPMDHPKNVVLIVIDSLRADMWTSDVLPNLTDLEKLDNAQFFSRHISGGNVTKSGIFSIFYGLPTQYWDAFAASATAPEWIRQHQLLDYQIGVFSSATLISPAFDRTVFASIPDLRLHTIGIGSAERDLQTLKEFQVFLESRDDRRPFFGFVFLDASHNYDVPKGYEIFQPQSKSVDHAKLGVEFDPVPFMNRYRNSLRFIDDQLGLLVEKLRADKILQDTILIVTSDHGEQFNDLGQNYWGHGSNFTPYQVRVPLLILWPGMSGANHDYKTSHYDIAPTILQDVMGCVNEPVDYSVGGNLFNESFPRPWVMVNSYYNYGVILEDRIVATYPLGQYEVLSHENQLLENQSIEAELARQVMTVLSRYRKRTIP